MLLDANGAMEQQREPASSDTKTGLAAPVVALTDNALRDFLNSIATVDFDDGLLKFLFSQTICPPLSVTYWETSIVH